ncbi:fungal specific transcription factor [Purpureocillium lilacinum]|uniref:Fungal specific transcription factor n=1 Tax=Purpureocillium lilacinum TaxID=33203 RepID=A0A179GGA0_PURLI|nr:fungal specific transcription factor [Purpureocillium lilacinum]OAQ76852.1 fungal specific transcription factor [Purpureocillium lilacinum]
MQGQELANSAGAKTLLKPMRLYRLRIVVRSLLSTMASRSRQWVLPERCAFTTLHGVTRADSLRAARRQMCKLGSDHMSTYATSAIPDGELHSPSSRNDATNARVPISAILGCRFPDRQLIHSLLEDYFEAVHWFSLVVCERRFRRSLSSVDEGYASPSDAPFLTLLSIVLAMAAWYRSKRIAAEDCREWQQWTSDLIHIVESRMVYIMDDRSVTAVQTCILLGSHHVYHGRPNLSFALLGAAIKISHALGLHRHIAQGDAEDIEERKRVWWTVYTWDRFASISYGRPMTINDEDCDVQLPTEFAECPYFVQESTDEHGLDRGIVYSPYQTELSKLYRIASPALRNIFGYLSPGSTKQRFETEYASLASEVTTELLAWRSQLPPHLVLDLEQDYRPESSNQRLRAHLLQSLSLQLTFDNLLIVLYRPFLARQVDHLSMESASLHDSPLQHAFTSHGPPGPSSGDNVNPHTNDHIPIVNHAVGHSEYWLDAAMGTTRITELPKLAALAKDSHLVAFMAINVFHAGIVLILLALSDPLSDRAQQLKRIVSRVLRLQEAMGEQSALSRQSGMVLQNLIALLVRREGDAMLGRLAPAMVQAGDRRGQVSRCEDHAMAEATPYGAPLRAHTAEVSGHTSAMSPEGQVWPNVGVAQRLNESLASVQHGKTTDAHNML